jgi:hypothetical protein
LEGEGFSQSTLVADVHGQDAHATLKETGNSPIEIGPRCGPGNTRKGAH